jgi:hypothetical protein
MIGFKRAMRSFKGCQRQGDIFSFSGKKASSSCSVLLINVERMSLNSLSNPAEGGFFEYLSKKMNTKHMQMTAFILPEEQ